MKKIALLFLGLSTAIISCDKKDAGTTTGGQVAGRVVYVNTDTLLNNYDYYKDIVKEFESKRFALENDLARKGQSFQNEVAMFSQRAQQGGMTQEQAQTVQQQLGKKEQDIMAYRDQSAAKLQEDQAKKTDELLTKIQTYLKDYNKDNKYDMVIGYSKGGGVLYAKEDLDITADVLKGLNEAYKKNGGEAKKDTTAKK